jgi:membrane protein YdbS with pleckstrin-like domain
VFKLPICPHCRTIYRYGDVRKNLNTKIHTCYHCKKQFKTSFSGLWILLLIIIAIGIIVNLIEISVFARTNVTALLVTNIILVLFFLLFVPFFTKFRKFGEDMQKDKNITASKKQQKKQTNTSTVRKSNKRR